MFTTLSFKFKIAMCALVLGFTLTTPVMAAEAHYTDDYQAPLQQPPAIWIFSRNGNELFAGTTENHSASGNIVTINYTPGKNIPDPYQVFGGLSNSGDASNNQINLINGSITHRIHGVYLGKDSTGNAENNTITILGGSVGDQIFGVLLSAYATGSVSHNTVNIGGDAVVNRVHCGYAANGTQTMNYNTVNIYGNATVNGDIHAAISGGGEAKYNTVNISGGTVIGSVYAAHGANSTVGNYHYNTVHISGAPNLSGAKLFGNNQKTWATDGNTLIVDDYRGSQVKSVSNFQNYQFIIGDNVTETNAALKVDNPVNLNGTTVGITGLTTSLSNGAELMLINNTNQGELSSYFSDLVALNFATTYQFEYYYNDEALMARVNSATPNAQPKALSEGVLAGAVFLNHKNDLVNNLGMPAMNNALNNGSRARLAPFTAMQGGGSIYKTGSSLNVKGFSGLAGLAVGFSNNLSIGAFFEGGWGNYNSRNSFNNAPSVKGNGGTRYYGGGVMARQNNIWGGLYAQGAFSMGRSEVDFRTNDMVNVAGQRAEYDSSSTYYSAHVGLGYLLDLTENAAADIYANYVWNRTGQDNVTVGSDPVKFKAVDSHRAQLGARVNYSLMPGFTPYAGAAWEYEFGGKAEARISGMPINAPSVRGATGMGELGFTLRPNLNAPLYIEAGVQGYVGKREGVTGTVRLSLTF